MWLVENLWASANEPPASTPPSQVRGRIPQLRPHQYSRDSKRSREQPLYYKEDRVLSHNFSAVLNDPLAPDDEIEWGALVILDRPGLTDADIGLSEVTQFYQRVSAETLAWKTRQRASKRAKGARLTEQDEDSQELKLLRRRQLEKCRAVVPQLFFQPDYSLTAYYNSNLSAQGSVPGPQESEQLSTFVDHVEHNLFVQISHRRKHFLHALKNVIGLRTEVAVGLQGIHGLRTHLRTVYAQVAGSKLRMLAMARRKRNQARVLRILGLVEAVKGTPAAVKLLVEGKDFTGAMELIKTTKELVQNDLAGLKCLGFVSMRLAELTTLVGKFLVQEFLEVAVGTIGAVEPLNESDGKYLLQLLPGIHSVGKLLTLAAHLREALHRSVKQGLTDKVFDFLEEVGTSTSAGDDEEPDAAPDSMASRFDKLLPAQYFALLQSLFKDLSLVIQRAASTVELITNALAATGTGEAYDVLGDKVLEEIKTTMNIHIWVKQATTQFQNVLITLTEFCHSKSARIFSTRQKANVNLTVAEFKELSGYVQTFITFGEQFTRGKSLTKLKLVLTKHGKAMLAELHTQHLILVTKSLDDEKWGRVLVPRAYQKLVNNCLASTGADQLRDTQIQVFDRKRAKEATSLTDALKMYVDVLQPASEAKTSTTTTTTTTANSGREVTKRMYFPVTRSALLLLDSLAAYIHCAVSLPFVASDVIHKLSELLKLYNSRTCQLVLGAGAMHLASLVSITATHLALASQCLALIVTQIHAVRRTLQRKLPESYHMLLKMFDRAEQDYHNHRDEIFSKIVAIVEERVQYTCTQVQASVWMKRLFSTSSNTVVSSSSNLQVESTVRMLMKQICSLHNTLADVLSEGDLDVIFTRVAATLYQSMRTLFVVKVSKVTVTRAFQDRVVINLGHIIMRLRSLAIFADGSTLEQLNTLLEGF